MWEDSHPLALTMARVCHNLPSPTSVTCPITQTTLVPMPCAQPLRHRNFAVIFRIYAPFDALVCAHGDALFCCGAHCWHGADGAKCGGVAAHCWRADAGLLSL